MTPDQVHEAGRLLGRRQQLERQRQGVVEAQSIDELWMVDEKVSGAILPVFKERALTQIATEEREISDRLASLGVTE